MNRQERAERHEVELLAILDFLATFERPYRIRNQSPYQQVRRGAATYEVMAAAGMSEGTANARLRELEADGRIVRSSENRDSWWRLYWYHDDWRDHAGPHSWSMEAAIEADREQARKPGPRGFGDCPVRRVNAVVANGRLAEVFDALCTLEGRRPHQLVHDTMYARLVEAQHDPHVKEQIRLQRRHQSRLRLVQPDATQV